ncbi:MAG: ECF transporter S component [Candidatus Bathyarchaeota archaeon]|nr:ECF transporter S component [Candidatus Termiticorpusculum sp.]
MRIKTVSKKHRVSTIHVTAAAVFAALVAIVTMISVIPIPATSGYFNLGEALIYSSALLLGPFVGLFAGAGAFIADIPLASVYAPGTLVIKSAEGFLVGYLLKKFNRKIKSLTLCAFSAILIGGCVMVIGYFIYEMFLFGFPYAILGVPFNVVQMLTGLLVAVPVMYTVLRAFPQLGSYF